LSLCIDSFHIATMGFIISLHQFHGEQGSEISKPFRRDGNEEPNMAYVAIGNPVLTFRIIESVGAKRDYGAERTERYLRLR
jgi:hypothetical protein